MPIPHTGLIVGKFYPPHLGHKFLIDTALLQVERLYVLVASKPTQAIPAELRAQWLRQIHPEAIVKVIEDGGFDGPEWARRTVEDWLGFVPDVIFSSESYGEEYADLLGCRHVMVDKERLVVPITATQIRANPLAHFQFLLPVVQEYYKALNLELKPGE